MFQTKKQEIVFVEISRNKIKTRYARALREVVALWLRMLEGAFLYLCRRSAGGGTGGHLTRRHGNKEMAYYARVAEIRCTVRIQTL